MAGSKIRCLYCDEPHDFLSGSHFKREDHFGPQDDAFEQFKAWVAEKYHLNQNHEVLQTPGALTRPETHEKYTHLFEK